MSSADNTDVVHDTEKPINFTNCERRATSGEFQVTDNHLTYRLTDVNEPIHLTELIRKVSLSTGNESG